MAAAMAQQRPGRQRLPNMIDGAINIPVRRFASTAGLGAGRSRSAPIRPPKLNPHVHLPDAAAVDDAAELITQFGGFAADEAAARADRSRNLGNVVHYCRWRQIQRLIELLADPAAGATLH